MTPTLTLRPNEVHRTVPASAQTTIGDLKIGVGNIWEDTYLDAAGQTQTGLTTGLWFFVRERSDLDQAVRAYAGQEFMVAGYQVRVLVINAGGPVELGITPPPE